MSMRVPLWGDELNVFIGTTLPIHSEIISTDLKGQYHEHESPSLE